MATKKSLKELSDSIDADAPSIFSDPSRPRRTAPGRLVEFAQFANDLDSELVGTQNELTELKRKFGFASLNRFHKVPGRQRSLNDQQRAELKANMLSLGKLITPLTVEIRDDGDFDIVAGNNRHDLATELGWESINYVVFNGTRDEANASALYSNLLHPKLPDYEKYLGLKKRMMEANLTQSELAQESGLLKSTISRLFSFSKLPQECIELIELNPSSVGLTAAAQLASLINDGKLDSAIKYTRELIEKKEEQDLKDTVFADRKTPTTITPRPKITPQIYKSGRNKIIETRSANNYTKITFAKEADRAELEPLINDVIKKFMNEKYRT